MESCGGPKREIATVSCLSNNGGQFLVTYDAPKVKLHQKVKSLSPYLNEAEVELLSNFIDKNNHCLERSLLFQCSSICPTEMADDSLEILEKSPKTPIEDQLQLHNNKSFSNLRTPARSITPATRASQTVTKDSLTSKRLFDSIRKKFEKGSKNDVPPVKMPQSSTSSLKTYKSLPRLDRAVGNQKKPNMAVKNPHLTEVKVAGRPMINSKVNEAQESRKYKIQAKPMTLEKKAIPLSRVPPKATAPKAETKQKLAVKETPAKNRFQNKIVGRSGSSKTIKKDIAVDIRKVNDSSPTPEKSPASPDTIVVESSNERKKWSQSTDMTNLSTATLYHLSSQVRNKTTALLHIFGIDQQEISHEESTPPTPIFKSVDPYISATIRRLEQIDRNLNDLESFARGQEANKKVLIP